MSVSLSKAPAVPAAHATGYVVLIPGTGGYPVNVQSVQASMHTPGYVHVHVEDAGVFWSSLQPAGQALPLSADQHAGPGAYVR